jgi:hypothetical protein
MRGYLPSAFTGEDMPPMICHVPSLRIHVCVIRNLSVPDLGAFAIGPRRINSIVVDRNIAGYLNGELLD